MQNVHLNKYCELKMKEEDEEKKNGNKKRNNLENMQFKMIASILNKAYIYIFCVLA